jgi:phytanoyl-CoA hydroxylase
MKLYGISMDEKMLWERDGYLVLDGFLSEQEVAYYNERMDNAFVQFRHKGKSEKATNTVKL